MTVNRDNSPDVATYATPIVSQHFVKQSRSTSHLGADHKSAIRRLRPSRNIKTFLRILGTFTIIVEDERIREVWTSNHRHRKSISRALLNRRLDELQDDSSRQIARAWKADWSTGRAQELTIEVPLADGSHTFVLASMPLASVDDSVRSACIVARDITDIRKSRAALEKSESLFAQAEQLASIGSWEVDLANKHLYWSENYYRMLGLPVSDGPVSVNRGLALVHPDDRERAARDADGAEFRGEFLDHELRYLTRDRGERVFHTRAIPVRDETGRVVRIRGMSQDITEQRLAEQSLRQREALLSAAEQIAKVGSYECDPQTGALRLSPNLHEIWGVEKGYRDWNMDDCWKRVHPDDRERLKPVALQAISGQKPFQCLLRYEHPTKGLRHLYVSGVPVLDATGRLARRVGAVRDVTEEYAAERKLHERDALLTTAEEIANFGSYQFDVPTQRPTMSPNLRKIYGMSPDEEWTRHFYLEHLHPNDRERVLGILKEVTKRPKRFEYVTRYIRAENDVRVLLVRGVPIFDNARRLIKQTGVVQDITDRVRTEEDLRRLSQQLLNTRDQEQRRIARQMHETVGQSLAALNMTLRRIQDTAGKLNGSSRALLSSARQLTNEAVREVRTVSYVMHPPLLDEAGLSPALRWYARGFAERSGIGVDVQIPEDLPRSAQDVEIAIYRIVQEALTNVHRYSGSRTAQIRVGRSNGDLVAEIRDEGCGMALPNHRPGATPPGVGIAGMRERVQLLNGALEIDSAPGKGTTVRATIPVAAKPALFLMTKRES